MIGTLLNDRYLLEAELGRGGMGVVYRAKDTLLERDVAVKLVSLSGLGTEGRHLFLQEARSVARLNHPNVVAVHDAGQTRIEPDLEPVSFIVMELVPGQSLRSYTPTSLFETVDIIVQLCAALEQAHGIGLIHRDLKPENILVIPAPIEKDSSREGVRVKLMDFGLARTMSEPESDPDGTISGTLHYLAPEVILGQPAGPQADLYALGVVFYELVAGRSPFEADNVTALLSQRLHAPVVPPSVYKDGVPFVIDTLVTRLLSRQPQDRPASSTEVRRILFAWRSAGISPLPDQPFQQPMINRLVRGRLVGRKRDFAQATALWQEAILGNGGFLLISGEPGIGKTRFVQELTTYAELSGGVVLMAECYSEGGLPYMPIAQLLREAVVEMGSVQIPESLRPDLLALAPDLRLIFPTLVETDVRDPDSDGLRLFESVVSLITILVERCSVLIFVDDLHWADSGTLNLLRHVARRLRRQKLLLVGTYCEIELDPVRPFRQVLLDLRQQRLISRIKLSRLTREQTGLMLTTLLASEITQDFLNGIYQETEGNPFFVEEVCRTLVSSGKLYFENGRWHRPDMEDLEIPHGVQIAIQSRLDKLGKVTQEVLKVAALLGREFHFDMLQTVCTEWDSLGKRISDEQLVTALEKADELHLIEEVRSDGTRVTFTFSHSLIRSTLLAAMSTLRRQRSQRQAALSLERAYPDLLTELAPLLGRYFAEAGESEKAVQYLLKAGDTALSLFAYDDASDAYEKALLFLREMRANHKTARTLMKLGLTYHNTFRFDQAHAAYEEAFTWWQRSPALPDENLAPATAPFRTHLRPLYTIDPTRSAHFSSAIVIQQLFSGLSQIDSEHELIPDVAGRWDVLDGGRRYIFYLRDDVVWSDGRPVLADDFAYAWRRVLEPSSGSYPAELLYDIQGAREYHQGNMDDASALGVRAVDDRTLIVDLEGPASYFLQLLTHSVGMPVPRHVVQAFGDRWVELGNLVTNGSFHLVSKDDKRLILERNSSYHGRFTGNLDRVEARLIRSATEAWDEYRTDQLDCLHLMPLFSPEDHDRARRLHPDEYIGGRIPSVTFLALDVTRPPFDNILLRRALALAIDRDSLAAKWLMGQYPPAKGGFIPPGLPGHKGGIGIPFDPDKARRLLDKAGYSHADSMPPIDAQAFRGEVYKAIVSGLKEQWQSHLGMSISFRPFVAEERANIWLAGVSPEYPDADSFLRVNNWSRVNGWRRKKFEHLVEEARRVADWEERMAMYQQADRILVEDAAILPLVYGRAHVLLKPWVTKYPLSPLSIPYWKDMVMEDNR